MAALRWLRERAARSAVLCSAPDTWRREQRTAAVIAPDANGISKIATIGDLITTVR